MTITHRYRVTTLLLPLAFGTACQFDRPADVMPIDAREADALDAAPSCPPSTTVCDDAQGVYTECNADGTVVRQMTCPLGCATDVEKCLDIDPHNGLAMYLDMVASPPDITLTGAATLDPATGVVFDGGSSVSIPTFAPAPLPGLRILVVGSLIVEGPLIVAPNANLSRPIAIVAQRDIVIRGSIDVSANRDLAGPGGWPGTDPQHSQATMCIGRPVFSGPPSPGGGGGGGAVAGAAGGMINMTAGGVPGVADVNVEPLKGGCAGAWMGSGEFTYGGGGGGGLQLASRTAIRILGSGTIDASGGGGSHGVSGAGGAGGGAGGKILLAAPQVIFDGPAVVVSTKGGGGGGASSTTLGGYGSDGGTAATPASGGTSPVAPGGRGGIDATTFAFSGIDAPGPGASGGGGGGAQGIIVVHTTTGTINPIGGAALRGTVLLDRLRTRQIP